MKVWIVEYYVPYESCNTYHVCDTYEMADRLARKLGHHGRVHEWDVESESDSESEAQPGREAIQESANGEAERE